MRIGRKIGLSDDRGVYVAVAIALIVVAATVAGYFIILRPMPEPFSTISLLDSNHQAVDYPQTLIANQNSTFKVSVEVSNHENKNLDYQVQVKIAKTLPASIPDGVPVTPLSTFDLSIVDGGISQHQATVTENQVGSYSVVFELWQKDSSGSYTFTQNFCVLNIEVTA